MKKIIFVVFTTLYYAQSAKPNDLPNRIGNFTIEMLYHTSKLSEKNLIISPLTIWTALAAIAEGAEGTTRQQIINAIRWNRIKNKSNEFKELNQFLKLDTDSVKLAKLNTMFIDRNSSPVQEYRVTAKMEYGLETIRLKMSDSVYVASVINQAVSNVTNGLINKIVEPNDLENTKMVLSSAFYFEGQWSVPFNASSTSRLPFYDSNGEQIGIVDMMYKRFKYPLTYFRQLQARVVELPYGDGNSVSMYIMLPNPGVSLDNMFVNFQSLNLDTFFEEMRISKEDYPEDEVDCYLPRFKVESELDLTGVLKDSFGIDDLFNSQRASLWHIARAPVYVSKMFHRAQIEVTEKGTIAAAVTVAQFKSRNGIIVFNANRPFLYLIVEKMTNTILLGGIYREPSLC